MKKRQFIISIIGILGIILLYFCIAEDTISNILILFETMFSFLTLMIAIVLFDRYQAGSKLNDKTLEIVINYIDFLRKQTLMIEDFVYENKKLNKQGFSIIHFESGLKEQNKKDKKIFVNGMSFIKFYANIIQFLNSPWMPNEIKRASEFLKPLDSNKTYDLNDINEDIFLIQICGYDFDNKYLFELGTIRSCEQLLENISKLMLELTKWINKQASDINFNI